MITIKVPKDPLVTSILDVTTEKLYIDLTNELLKYASLLKKRRLNNQKIEMILFKESSSDVGGIDQAFLDNLEVQRVKISDQDSIISKEMNDILKRLLEILSALKEKDPQKEVHINKVGEAINYTPEEIDAIDAFIKLRRKSYEIVEYIGSFFVRKQVPKDNLSKELFAIAISSLKLFDIDQILNDTNKAEITKLMRSVLSLYSNRVISSKDLKSLSESLKDEKYGPLIERLQTASNMFLREAIK